MKHYIYSILLCIIGATLTCCNSSTEEFYADIEQDRDNDEITGDDYEYQIPVIFHVLYQDSQDKKQYVDYTRIKELVAHVNELYQGNVYTYQEYDNSENIHIRFVLAEKNEQNQTSNGLAPTPLTAKSSWATTHADTPNMYGTPTNTST